MVDGSLTIIVYDHDANSAGVFKVCLSRLKLLSVSVFRL